jgi:hypothetical protein
VKYRIPEYLHAFIWLVLLVLAFIFGTAIVTIYVEDTTPNCQSFSQSYYSAGFAPVSCYKEMR